MGTRNRPACGYLHIGDNVIWSIIQDAIPELVPSLRALLDTTGEDSAWMVKRSG